MSQFELIGMEASARKAKPCKVDWDRVFGCSNMLRRVAVVRLLHDCFGEISGSRERPKLAAICDALAVVSPYGMQHDDRAAYLAIAGIIPLPAEGQRIRHRLPSEERVHGAIVEESRRFIPRLKAAASRMEKNAETMAEKLGGHDSEDPAIRALQNLTLP